MGPEKRLPEFLVSNTLLSMASFPVLCQKVSVSDLIIRDGSELVDYDLKFLGESVSFPAQ
jgi:hypothetical protein